MPLLRGLARTAAIAGTATSVSNRVSRRQSNKWASKDAQKNEQYQQQAAPPAAPTGSQLSDDQLQQLEKLGVLNQKGVLTDQEFTAAKRQILNI